MVLQWPIRRVEVSMVMVGCGGVWERGGGWDWRRMGMRLRVGFVVEEGVMGVVERRAWRRARAWVPVRAAGEVVVGVVVVAGFGAVILAYGESR